jgi:hypothetical protein
MKRKFPICFIEEVVFHPPEGMDGFRFFRIEYGGVNEESVMTGAVWIPPGLDPYKIERLLQKSSPELKETT